MSTLDANRKKIMIVLFQILNEGPRSRGAYEYHHIFLSLLLLLSGKAGKIIDQANTHFKEQSEKETFKVQDPQGQGKKA